MKSTTSFMDRRRFLFASAATAALPSLHALAQATTTAATLKLHPGEPGPRIPGNFIGLSYETNELTNPTFFSADNTGLIEQFRALTPNGVLRIGGNTSDIGYWKPTPTTPPPEIHVRDIGGGDYPLAAAIEDKLIRAPRFFYAGKVLSMTGGHVDYRTPNESQHTQIGRAHV